MTPPEGHGLELHCPNARTRSAPDPGSELDAVRATNPTLTIHAGAGVPSSLRAAHSKRFIGIREVEHPRRRPVRNFSLPRARTRLYVDMSCQRGRRNHRSEMGS